ncbi:Mic27p Ecym_5407 [Eremothecium cymbalariae DBVPG|uniref:MICOS complex subunit MIC27 n=1 Tax=Eremothecium cymbalariae (strain CBS 270.75 / DBVPG 7215 / KCTC 17166 / NRRL Y-17582) TaxID=931890 RepID=I6NDL9_ERECY|nr:hypothetical protein Ecym_5407 [Eremothecium cymbalariae DBVPG\
MAINFYEYDETTDVLGTPLIPDVILKSNLRELTLPTGNQVLESLPLTKWFYETRSSVIESARLYNAEWKTQQSAARNELDNIKKYCLKNIFVDFNELYHLPQTNILTLCSYFAGRIVSNSNNWGLSKGRWSTAISGNVHHPSFLARMFTCIPSKVLLPWVLAGAVYKNNAPSSFGNAVHCVETDLLPPDFVTQYRSAWQQYYVNGLKKNAMKACAASEDFLQAQIRNSREFIIERTS